MSILILAAAVSACVYSGPSAAIICKSSELAKQAQRREEAIKAWRAVDTRDMAIPYRRDKFEEETKSRLNQFANAKSAVDSASKAASLIQDFTEEANAIEMELIAAKSIISGPAPAMIVEHKCLATHLPDCVVAESGFINDPGGKRLVMWQRMHRGASGPASEGMLVAWDISGERAKEIGHILVDGAIKAPVLIDQGEKQLLHLPAHGSGTGWSNQDALFEFDGRDWNNIEMEGWKREIPKRAPKGLALWHGVDYNFDGMTVEVPLWKPNDANCCATGGKANVQFEVKNQRLEITNWEFIGPAPVVAKASNKARPFELKKKR